jgi:hypothetical protein
LGAAGFRCEDAQGEDGDRKKPSVFHDETPLELFAVLRCR